MTAFPLFDLGREERGNGGILLGMSVRMTIRTDDFFVSDNNIIEWMSCNRGRQN